MRFGPRRARRQTVHYPLTLTGRYRLLTQQPLYCLLFLFPFVATYEFGALLLRPGAWPERHLVAQSLIQDLFGWFGATGFWLPGVALVLTLLAWHVLSRNPWQVRGWVPAVMLIESLVLTIPLLVLNRVLLPAAAPVDASMLRAQIILALGAGVYEELVFRLFLITGLTVLFVAVFRVPLKVATWFVVALAALIFALCHVQPIGAETFRWTAFLMRLTAGAYLSLLFITRGLGISTGCHAAFNLILLIP